MEFFASTATIGMLQTTSPAVEEWTPVGHSGPMDWLWALQHYAPFVFVLLLVFLLVQACRHRMRYRAVEILDMAAVDRLRRAVAEAEQETTGEIGVVVLERSDSHPQAPWAGAVFLTALASLSCAHFLGFLPVLPMLLAQASAGYVFYTLIWASADLRRRFVTSERAAEMAEEQAIQEFHALRLADTKDRTGVLLFVSLFERQVVVLADTGIADQVEENIWVEVDRTVLNGAKCLELEQGLLAGVRLVGSILKQHFPAQAGGDNQVEDHVVVRRE